MVAGFHLIWTAYGWWLPKDPRGSSSHEIRVEKIAELGNLHHGRKPIQPPGREIRDFYERAGDVLKHPLLQLEDADVDLVALADGMRDGVKALREKGRPVWPLIACS